MHPDNKLNITLFYLVPPRVQDTFHITNMGDHHSFSHSANHHSFTLQLKQNLRQTLIHLPVQADTLRGSTGRPWYLPSPPQMQTHTYQPSEKEFYALSCGLWLHHRLRCPHPGTDVLPQNKRHRWDPVLIEAHWDIKLILHQVNFCQDLPFAEMMQRDWIFHP